MASPIFFDVQARMKNAEPGVLTAQIDPIFLGDPNSFSFNLTGWAVGLTGPIDAVDLTVPNQILTSVPVNLPSPDLVEQFPDQPWAATARFSLPVSALDVLSTFKLRVRAIPADGAPIRIGLLRGSRRSQLADYTPALQPISLTTIGRTGSTALMRLLAEHPGIVTYRQYPYEVRPAKYWLHMLRILSSLPEPTKIVGQPNEFHQETLAIGASPFRPPSFAALPALEQWSNSSYLQHLLTFTTQSIDDWYRIVAAEQGTPDAQFFIETQFPDQFPPQMQRLYTGMKEIILVRDFRDMAVSMLAYNDRRGKVDFGRDSIASDEEWITAIGNVVHQLRLAYVRRRQTAHLVRYEDLIADPAATLTRILQYLGLDAEPAAVTGMIERAGGDESERARHQTASSTAGSIGRWETDLSPELRKHANTVFATALSAFGYTAATTLDSEPDDED